MQRVEQRRISRLLKPSASVCDMVAWQPGGDHPGSPDTAACPRYRTVVNTSLVKVWRRSVESIVEEPLPDAPARAARQVSLGGSDAAPLPSSSGSRPVQPVATPLRRPQRQPGRVRRHPGALADEPPHLSSPAARRRRCAAALTGRSPRGGSGCGRRAARSRPPSVPLHKVGLGPAATRRTAASRLRPRRRLSWRRRRRNPPYCHAPTAMPDGHPSTRWGRCPPFRVASASPGGRRRPRRGRQSSTRPTTPSTVSRWAATSIGVVP